MISLLLHDKKKQEAEQLLSGFRNAAADLSDEYWDMHLSMTDEDTEAYSEGEELLDFACVDIENGKTTGLVRGLRNRYSELSLMLIAEAGLSPLVYLKPGIRPDSLLLRPLDTEQAESTVNEFLSAGLKRREEQDEGDFFVVRNKDERTFVPYRRICYFEAREKKLYACTETEEYGFYASLEELAESLPEEFLRCHRSYLVNSALIKSVVSTGNYIELENGIRVPMSRSYKQSFREYRK